MQNSNFPMKFKVGRHHWSPATAAATTTVRGMSTTALTNDMAGPAAAQSSLRQPRLFVHCCLQPGRRHPCCQLPSHAYLNYNCLSYAPPHAQSTATPEILEIVRSANEGTLVPSSLSFKALCSLSFTTARLMSLESATYLCASLPFRSICSSAPSDMGAPP